MKTIVQFATLLVILSGCAGEVSSPNPPETEKALTAPDTLKDTIRFGHPESSTAHYAGAYGIVVQGCADRSPVMFGECSASWGRIEESSDFGGSWYCRVVPFDTKLGADMTITVMCP